MEPGDTVRYRTKPNHHERFGVLVSLGRTYHRVRVGRDEDGQVKRVKAEYVRLWKTAAEEAEKKSAR